MHSLNCLLQLSKNGKSKSPGTLWGEKIICPVHHPKPLVGSCYLTHMGKVGPTPRNLSFIMLYETDLNQCPKRDETHE